MVLARGRDAAVRGSWQCEHRGAEIRGSWVVGGKGGSDEVQNPEVAGCKHKLSEEKTRAAAGGS